MNLFKKKHFGILDILEFLDIKLSFEKFCCISSIIKPRYFTIASYCKPQSKELTIILKKEVMEISLDTKWTGLFTT